MSDKRVFILAHDTARRLAKAQVDNAPEGTVVTFDQPIKTRLQEQKYHAMVADIARCCKFMEREWDKETWKRLLIDGFVRVMRDEAKQKGLQDPFDDHGQVIPSLDGKGWVQLGVQSRRFKKRMAAEFIEYLYAWGTWHNVDWQEAQDWDQRYGGEHAER